MSKEKMLRAELALFGHLLTGNRKAFRSFRPEHLPHLQVEQGPEIVAGDIGREDVAIHNPDLFRTMQQAARSLPDVAKCAQNWHRAFAAMYAGQVSRQYSQAIGEGRSSLGNLAEHLDGLQPRALTPARTAYEISGDPDFINQAELVRTGVDTIDRITGGGLPRAGQTVIAGCTGFGKSSLMLTIAVTWAMMGLRSLIMSAELTKEKITMRLLAICIDRLMIRDFRNIQKMRADLPRLREEARTFLELIHVEDPPAPMWEDYQHRIRDHYDAHPDTVGWMLDYFQLFRATGYRSEEIMLRNIAEQSAKLARNQKTVGVLLAQLDKSEMERKVKDGVPELPSLYSVSNCTSIVKSTDLGLYFGNVKGGVVDTPLGKAERRYIYNVKSRESMPNVGGHLGFYGAKNRFVGEGDPVYPFIPGDQGELPW